MQQGGGRRRKKKISMSYRGNGPNAPNLGAWIINASYEFTGIPRRT